MTAPLKRCVWCGEQKLLECFVKRSDRKSGRQSYCLVCYREKQNESRDKNRVAQYTKKYREASPRMALRANMHNALKRRPTNNPITINYLLDIWEAQKGLCALTKRRMTWGRGKITATSISLDRINPDDGYEPKNVRLVCYAVNAFRGQMTDMEMLSMARDLVRNLEKPNLHLAA